MDDLMHIVNFIVYLFNPTTEPVFLFKEKLLIFTALWCVVWFVFLPDSKLAKLLYEHTGEELEFYFNFKSPVASSIVYTLSVVLIAMLACVLSECIWRFLPNMFGKRSVSFFWVLLIGLFVWYNTKQIRYNLLSHTLREDK